MHPLEEWLQESGTTQERLASLAETYQPRISAFLSGSGGLSPEVADRISKITGVTLEDLLLRRPKRRTAKSKRTKRGGRHASR